MQSYENSFARGSSPTYSDEASTAENGATPAITEKVDFNDYIDEKLNYLYATDTSALTNEIHIKKKRNTFAFWTVVLILLVLTLGNLILTLTIIGILHLGRGIDGMELIPEEDIIKFYGTTDLDRIYSKGVNEIEGFADEPLIITGDGAGVYFRLHRNGLTNNRLAIDNTGIQFRSVNTFEIKDPSSGSNIFTTHRPTYNMPSGANVLNTKSVSASRISSPIDEILKLESDTRISFKGSEGVLIDGSNVHLNSEHIIVNSTQGSIELKAGSGVYLDMDKIPIVSSEFGLRTGSVQYKLCICTPQGSLFRIAIPRVHNGPKISCAHFNSNYDPCSVN